MRGASTDVLTGVQLDRPARQSCDEELRRSSEARQCGSEDDCRSDYGILAPNVPLGSSSPALAKLTLKESRLYSA
jgi:hypothetical protein